jgi:hypothetical protein
VLVRGNFRRAFLELKVTQSVKSTYQTEQANFSVSIAQSLNQLKLARSQSLQAMTALPTAATIGNQIELRNVILHHLRELGSALSHQISGNASGSRSFSPLRFRNGPEGTSARRIRHRTDRRY